ncbi:MAG: spermidine synthase [Gammaproteobacteria bacterium]
MTTGQTQRSLYIIFALSGFSGLIYESVWSHYLKLFLGHAAYAQALVLVIFMGGMALGAWLISRTSHHFANLLLGYAIIEGVIGLFGLVFHPLFQSVLAWSFDSVIPALGTPVSVQIYKFSVATLLILPQSILLGATFPLMSGGFIRRFPEAPGKTISVLYFANSIGAAIALLVAAFYLIGKMGLPGTILTAALLNIALAILVYGLSKGQPLLQPATSPRIRKTGRWPWIFLAASFFTGMASFIYEVAWIRMLSMVLGSSTHSFELMLSAFITGLAIGGYWIRKKIDTLQDPVGFAGLIQVIMGLFAFSTIFLYSYSFEIMSFFMRALDQTDPGYLLFSLASHAIALLVMLPATICAGMTLPLFTFILYKRGYGERSIGQIYSSNTIGAIFGVVFTVFIGMPVLGLKNAILTGAFIDIAIGLVLLTAFSSILKLRHPLRSASLGLGLFLLTMFYYDFDPRRMASGVFRHGGAELDPGTEILFHQDGKTASVTASIWSGRSISIFTNGKPDAAITMDPDVPPSVDEATMTMLGALPLSIKQDIKTVANIGMGSGLTSHVVLSRPEIERVDTIEIEEAMIRGARHYLPRTERVFNDPRSRIHVDDARTFFSTHGHKYDVIISEPSNPWVSGVSSLFTQEFYGSVKTHLNEDGLFVQWLQIYEFNLELMISVLKALSAEFPYYSIYFADKGNLLLVAGLERPVAMPSASVFDEPELAGQLSRIHINNLQDLKFRFLGDQRLYNSFIHHFPVPVNSDYFPILDLRAPKSRFLDEDVSELLNLRLASVPILDLLYPQATGPYDSMTVNNYYPETADAGIARWIYDFYEGAPYKEDNFAYAGALNQLLTTAKSCDRESNPALWTDAIYLLMGKTVSYLGAEEVRTLITAMTPDCEQPVLSAYQQDWLALFQALVDRNGREIVSVGERLLDADETPMNIYQEKFILTAMLAAMVSLGEQEQASTLWTDHMATLFITGGDMLLEIQLLLAQINEDD